MKHSFGAILGVGAMLLLFSSAQAQTIGIETDARQAFMIDAQTGYVLLSKDADTLMPPSSMSKMMTVDMVFEKLKRGELKLDDQFSVSERAWRQGGSKMFVHVGDRVKVEDLLRGIMIQSGNDACIVVAEGLAGTEERFAEQMTARAREIGLTKSVFRNATGWPDPQHLTTARELAMLAKYTITTYPEYYHYYHELNFTYAGIKQENRNPLLFKNLGADGIKTGHTDAAGFGLTGSAVRGDRRLILVVNGLTSMAHRARESERLIEWGFREFENLTLFRQGERVEDVEVWLGEQLKVPVVSERDLVVTLPRSAKRDLKVSIVYEGPAPAPVQKGVQLATLRITGSGIPQPIEMPLVAGADVERLGPFGRVAATVSQMIWGSGKK